MKVLIVDDEPLARSRLRKMLAKFDQVEIVGEAGNGREAIARVNETRPDLVFMDIRMPGMDGLEAAGHLDRLDEGPAVVFTTAYDEYALEAFDVHAIGYLVKPVRAEKLAETMASIERRSLSVIKPASSSRTHISAKYRGNIELVPVDQIYFLRAEHKYVVVRYPDGELLIEESLKSLEDEFKDAFLRVHRNALVAPGWLQGMSKSEEGQWFLTFKNIDDQVEVSRRHTAEVRRLLNQL